MSISYVELIEDMKKVCKDDADVIYKYEDRVLEANNPELSMKFCDLVKGAHIKKHGAIVAKKANGFENYVFAKDHPYADMHLHSEAIANCNSMDTSLRFISTVKSLDTEIIAKHTDIIIHNANAMYIYLLADLPFIDTKEVVRAYLKRMTQIKGSDNGNINTQEDPFIIKLADLVRDDTELVLGLGDILIKYCPRVDTHINFIFEFPCADIKKHQAAVIGFSHKHPSRLLRFAHEVRGADLIELEKAIIDCGKYDEMLEFMKDFDSADIDMFTNWLINNDNKNYLIDYAGYDFCRNFEVLDDYIFNNGTPIQLAKFSINDKVDTKKYLNAVLESKDLEANSFCITHYKYYNAADIDIKKHVQVFLDSENDEYMITVSNVDHPDIDLTALANKALKSDDVLFLIQYAHSVKNVDLRLFYDRICNLTNDCYNQIPDPYYLYFVGIKGAVKNARSLETIENSIEERLLKLTFR